MSNASTARTARKPAAERIVPPSPSAMPEPNATTEIGAAALAYLKELDDQASRFMHEAGSAMAFMEYVDEQLRPEWASALGIMLPITRRFFDYARLFEELGCDLRKALITH